MSFTILFCLYRCSELFWTGYPTYIKVGEIHFYFVEIKTKFHPLLTIWESQNNDLMASINFTTLELQ